MGNLIDIWEEAEEALYERRGTSTIQFVQENQEILQKIREIQDACKNDGIHYGPIGGTNLEKKVKLLKQKRRSLRLSLLFLFVYIHI